jgi:hypothetical protein
MAGRCTLEGTSYPFILVGLNGNMQVVIFMARGEEPMANPESFIVQLAIANEPSNDLLLVGGDFNNEPFSAFRRAGSPATGGQ